VVARHGISRLLFSGSSPDSLRLKRPQSSHFLELARELLSKSKISAMRCPRSDRRSVLRREACYAVALVWMISSLGGCGPVTTKQSDVPLCDDALHPSAEPPSVLATRGSWVGSGDTWFAAPATGTFSQDVRWDGQTYFVKIGMWTLTTQQPEVAVRQVGGAGGSGTASSSPTTAGLPGPLPTTLRFPTVGCWEVLAQGLSGLAAARISVDESAKTR